MTRRNSGEGSGKATSHFFLVFLVKNFIIDERAGKVTGYIDFDNWQVGVKEQEFVKMQYWGLRELDPAFNKA